ncbi:MAG: transporter substrate-binding domain-containing protein [Candidatus Cloacimonadaceae bacterium]|nr:transporter substrate-binding domain-containing protein [Candidatus Cloacimonadaceae bacterium]
MKRILLFLVVVFCLGIIYGQNVENVRKTISIGGDYSYPPYEYLDDNHFPAGYNVELSRRLAEQMDMTPRFRLAKWAQVRSWLDDGLIDMVQGMALSSQRARTYYFSKPHTQTWRSFFVRKGSGIKSSSDLINAKVVLQQGDIAKDFLSTIEFAGSVAEVPTQEDALKLLNKGVYDAAIVNHMHGMFIVGKDKLEHISVLWDKILVKDYCYASKDKELIERIDVALLKLATNGELDTLHKKWFAPYAEKLPHVSLLSDTGTIITIIIAFLGIFLSIVMAFRHRGLRNRLRKLSTEHKTVIEHESELLREHQLIDSSSFVFYKCSVNTMQLKYISPSISQWGYTSEDLINEGMGMMDHVHEEDRNAILELIQKSPETDPCTSTKYYRIFDSDKNIHWVYDFSIIVHDDRGEAFSYGFMQDVSSQKEMEKELIEARDKAESASIAKEQFLAGVSHEIRTPLNGIIGLINVLREMESDHSHREIMDLILSSGKSLMGIVSNILDFSKIESGKLELMPGKFNPRYLIEELIKSFVLQREKGGIDIRSRVSDDIPDFVIGDMLRLRQIMTNLLQNAIKFTNSGWVELSAEVYTLSEDDIRILFCVSDTGIGMKLAKVKDIFDRFGKADSTISNSYTGSGLGLSIVRRLVELMEGLVWVESETGSGSRFFFLIPFRLTDTTDADVARSDPASMNNSMLILLVEDDPVSQKVTKLQLEKWGMQVDVANSGYEALELYDAKTYDCILLDLHLPSMDGITVCRLIREHERKRGIYSKIVALTAASTKEDRARCLEAGIDEFVTKPVDFRVLHRLITKDKQE